MSEHYFTFPLAVLNGEDFDENGCAPKSTPANCIELALFCGILGAGKGYKHHHGHEAFKTRLEEVCDGLEMGDSARPGPCSERGEVLVGADICNVKLGSHNSHNLERIAATARRVTQGGPLVRMKSDYFWSALNQARAEEDPKTPWPEMGISWREFRILAAILSVKTNRAGFAFIGWETIQARAHGFTTKDDFKKRKFLQRHLAPPLSRKQIRATCDTLEALGFFARFRLSSGARGGLMAYSVRHEPAELAKAVCDSVNFRDRSEIRSNRANDAAKCLELLERAKSGPSQGQVRANSRANSRAKVGANIMRNPMGEKSHE